MKSRGFCKKTATALFVSSLVIWLIYYSYPSNIEHRYPAVGEKSSYTTNIDLFYNNKARSESCSAHNHIMFLKTHKCASSTVQNIFLRYGYSRKLINALASGSNYLGNPSLFKASMMPMSLLPPSGKVDIFAVHTRLNPVEHRKVLHKDAFWVTVVRDPVTLFESLYNYFELNNVYKKSIEEFSNTPLKELQSLPRDGKKFGINQMLFDMGYDPNLDSAAVKKVIEELDSNFHLVMISDLLDESLILLRHLLCWRLDDIVFFKKNARRENFKPQLPLSTQHKIQEINSGDFMIYEYFLAKHRAAVMEFGIDRMAKEVKQLQNLRESYLEGCSIEKFDGLDPKLEFKEYSSQVNAYAPIGEDVDEICVLLSMPELYFIDHVRKQQKELLGGNSPFF